MAISDAAGARPRDLAVLLHAWSRSSKDLEGVADLVRRTWRERGREVDVQLPEVGTGLASFRDPDGCAADVVGLIDKCWDAAKSSGGYDEIILFGHSIGSLLARKAYVMACGDRDAAPLGRTGFENPREWAPRVGRLVLLSGMNRGWSFSHHLEPLKALQWFVGILFARLCLFVTFERCMPVIYAVRRGAPFITNLRLQWLAMCDKASGEIPGNALTVQLLGSVDDMVAPEDSIDLASGRDFYYLDVPFSGHADVILVGDKQYGVGRAQIIQTALTAPRSELAALTVVPTDEGPRAVDPRVTDVVFVMHGIRDQGFWTHKIARAVEGMERRRNREKDKRNLQLAPGALEAKRYIKSETSSYGYFAMLPFLLRTVRRQRMEWLMDRYTENRARYPNAQFSYVGHSHGTYMLARALRDYPCVRFRNVVFAGSVVRRDYRWDTLIGKQVGSVLNFVANADWVVAIFPKFLQLMPWHDLGSAGHDGFFQANKVGGLDQIEYVPGSHGAALKEGYWEAIAKFVLDGTRPQVEPTTRNRRWLIVAAGLASPLIWGALFLGLVGVGLHILRPAWSAEMHGFLAQLEPGWVGGTLAWMVPATGSSNWDGAGPAVLFMLYLFLCWKVLTRV